MAGALGGERLGLAVVDVGYAVVRLARQDCERDLAGRGVIFILLALGLMGTRRLSLALTALLCGTNAMGLLDVGRAIALTDWLELLMLIICCGLLFISTGSRVEVRHGPSE